MSAGKRRRTRSARQGAGIESVGPASHEQRPPPEQRRPPEPRLPEAQPQAKVPTSEPDVQSFPPWPEPDLQSGSSTSKPNPEDAPGRSKAFPQAEWPAGEPSSYSADRGTARRTVIGPPTPRRASADDFPAEAEPDWLRSRRSIRQPVPVEQWRTTRYDEAELDEAQGATRIALPMSEIILAALPLVVGLILLYLGWGRAG